MRRVGVFAALLTLGLSRAQDGPESVITGTKRFQKRVLVSGLENPWEVAWGPDNMLWVTERTGKRVTRIDPKSGERSTAVTIEEASAPGGQNGVLGLAFDAELLKGTGHDYVYVAYSYVDKAKGPHKEVGDATSPYRSLYVKVARFRYDAAKHTLGAPVDVLTGLPGGDDHQGGRLKFGPGKKLYLTIGDQGHGQFGNFCLPIEAQRLPTRVEVRAHDYSAYVGKTLRMNVDGSIPKDNPKLQGVVSHVYTYGHRNPQGLDYGANGVFYSSEHGPKTDDEINVLTAGSNYGWPNVAGFQDNKAYKYARWADSTTPCQQLKYDDTAIPAAVPQDEETDYRMPFVNPLATMFTVPTGYNFADPACKGVDVLCWPTVAVSSVEYYEAKGTGIPGWEHVLLAPTLKRGSLYVLPLSADGRSAAGHFSRYFPSANRFRDTAVSPDGRTIYIATDSQGLSGSADAALATRLEDPGAILAFTYIGEGDGKVVPATVTATAGGVKDGTPVVNGMAPLFTGEQAEKGKSAYEANCAVCHGSTLKNGAYGTPLAGEYFQSKWFGRSVRELYEKARSMPPGRPGSLTEETYREVVAYALRVNGFKAGSVALGGTAEMEKMVMK